jgi:hypothetical protein
MHLGYVMEDCHLVRVLHMYLEDFDRSVVRMSTQLQRRETWLKTFLLRPSAIC